MGAKRAASRSNDLTSSRARGQRGAARGRARSRAAWVARARRSSSSGAPPGLWRPAKAASASTSTVKPVETRLSSSRVGSRSSWPSSTPKETASGAGPSGSGSAALLGDDERAALRLDRHARQPRVAERAREREHGGVGEVAVVLEHVQVDVRRPHRLALGDAQRVGRHERRRRPLQQLEQRRVLALGAAAAAGGGGVVARRRDGRHLEADDDAARRRLALRRRRRLELDAREHHRPAELEHRRARRRADDGRGGGDVPWAQ